MTATQEAIDWCNGFPESKRWLSHYGTAKAKITTAMGFKLFCDLNGLTPPELLALYEKSERKLFNLIDDFAAKTDLPNESRRGGVSAVRSFFKENYIDMPSKVGDKVWTLGRVKAVRVPTKETLRTFLQGAWHIRDQALITFMACSCVAEGSIPHLTFRNIEPGWQEKHPKKQFEYFLVYLESVQVPHIKIVGRVMPDGSTTLKGGGQGKYLGTEQHTFLTPEGVGILMDYIKWRLNEGEKLDYDSALFALFRPKRLRGKALTIGGVKTMFKAVSERNPKQIHFSAHDMRRFVQNALEDGGVHENRCIRIRGRKVPGEKDPYSRPKIDQLRTAYQDAIPFLTIQKAKEIISREDLRRDVMEAIAGNKHINGILKTIAEKRGVSVEVLRKNLATIKKEKKKP